MSEIKTLDKLRESVLEFAPNIRRKVCVALDEIQAEVDSKYMLLPVDVNGEPIRVGETVYDIRGQQTVVREIGFIADSVDVYCQIVDGYGSINVNPECLTHVKPRTLEDIVTELLDAGAQLESMNEMVDHSFVERYAKEIRELLGGDE